MGNFLHEKRGGVLHRTLRDARTIILESSNEYFEAGREGFVLELFVAAGRFEVLSAAGSSSADSFGGYYVVDS